MHPALRLAATLISMFLPSVSFSSQAHADIDWMLKHRTEFPNPFKDYALPTRETMLANARAWDITLRYRRLTGPQPHDCAQELFAMEEGFHAIYPDAPKRTHASIAWSIHIAAVHYPELVLCETLASVEDSLRKIAEANHRVPPLEQRSDPWKYEARQYRWKIPPLRRLEYATKDLIWLSYRGYSPAMLELLKLADRIPIVRLTTRFKYYLLVSATKADLKHPLLDHLQPKLTKMLPDPDIAELETMAETSSWPISERMVID